MGERTSYAPGTHSWVDLATTDTEAAKRFYTELLGWDDVREGDAGEGRTYGMVVVGDKTAAGLFRSEDEMPPHWNCYVTVESADASVEKVEAAGGEVVLPPFDVMGAGRMLVIRDPTGAFLALWEAREHPGAERVNEPGCLTWNDLNTSDPEAAQRFYERLFGWRFEKVEGGFDYWVIYNGERTNGGMRPFSEPERQAGLMSHWLPYFAVEDTDAALEKAGALGGRVMAGPYDVPGGGRIGVILDPQNAPFAIFAGEFDD